MARARLLLDRAGKIPWKNSYSSFEEEAGRMHRVLENKIARLGLPEIDLIGPVPAFLSRIRGQYRWHLMVRGRDPRSLLGDVTFPLGWRADADPVSVL